MQEIPQYVAKLISRRQKLAESLQTVSFELDQYCKRIGIDIYDDDYCLGTHEMIYLEPKTAASRTIKAIKSQLQNNENKRISR